MQWDIDKVLTDFTAPGVLLEKSVTMVVLDQDVWERYGLKLNVDPTRTKVITWCLTLGLYNGPKLITHALTIREAYLKMRKVIKGLTPEVATTYGVKGKPKRKKFERREKKPKIEPVKPKKKVEKRRAR
jgi:hypothetical protein